MPLSRGFLLLGLVPVVGLLLTSGAVARAEAENAAKNIVVVLTDDEDAFDGRLMDYMPNAKAIFKDAGITFTDFHASSPLCCPSRANFFTGQFTHNHGVGTNSAGNFKPSMTIATQLQSIGYYTALVGKYLNRWINVGPAVPPGWSRFIAAGDASGDGRYYNYKLWIDGSSTPEQHGGAPEDYSTDVFRQKAVEVIAGAPSGQPLFLWIGTYAPHTPSDVAPRHQSAPCSPPLWSPANYNEADVSDKPSYVRSQSQRSSTGGDLTTICRQLLAVDDLVAAVRDALAAAGRLDNTIFIYTSDNGMNFGAHRLFAHKSTPYATHVPFHVSWPARLGAQPRAIAERLQNVDLAPTLCEIAGCTLGPYPNGQSTPDGVSFAALLIGSASSAGRDAVFEEMIASENPVPYPWAGVVTTGLSPLGRWHYVEYANGEKELYDISNGPCWAWQPGDPGDPCELESKHADPALAGVRQALQARLAELKAQKGSGGGGGGGNAAPVCRNLTLTAAPGTVAEIAPDCSDANGDPLTYAIAAGPSKGSAEVTPEGKLRYQAAADAAGSDTFSYRANDGKTDGSAAVVTVKISSAGGVGQLALVPSGDAARAGIRTQSGGTTRLWRTLTTLDDGATYLRNSRGVGGSYVAELSDTPTDFGRMLSLRIVARGRTSAGNDTITLKAQALGSNGEPLTDEVAVAANLGSSGWTTAEVDFTGLTAGTKAGWDGARLRLTWSYVVAGTSDLGRLKLTWVELRGTYAA